AVIGRRVRAIDAEDERAAAMRRVVGKGGEGDGEGQRQACCQTNQTEALPKVPVHHGSPIISSARGEAGSTVCVLRQAQDEEPWSPPSEVDAETRFPSS